MNSPAADHADITVAILAGGRAERLAGADKGLHELDGRPLIESVLDALRLQDVSRLLIVANRNPERYAHYATTINDSIPDYRGPMAGIAAALAACSTRWMLSVPVDCPQPPVDLLARLLAAACSDDACAIVAHDGERRQPLFAIYTRELASSAAQAALEGQGVWQWQDSRRARELDFSDQRAHFCNLNTTAEFVAYAQRGRD